MLSSPRLTGALVERGGAERWQRGLRALACVACVAATSSCRRPDPAATVRDPYEVRRATGPIDVDGRGDDDAWRAASWSPDFAPTEGGAALDQRTRARLLYDDEFLYVLVEADDDDVFSPYARRDEPLWKADVVEVFIDADGSGAGYVELQVNPNNAQFDAWFAHTRREGLDKAWSADMKSAVSVRGTADDRTDRDRGWTAEIAVPLRAVLGRDAAMKVTLPPVPGDRWRLNVVRIDKPAEAAHIRAASWNPIPIQDFHALGRMITVVFQPGAQ